MLTMMRGTGRAVLLLGVTGALLPPAMLAFALSGRSPNAINRLWYRSACRIAGIRVRVVGTPVRDRSVLFASNHVSYVDIPAIGTAIDTRFIAKAEVATWPLFGLLAKLANTVFLKRDRREVRAQRDRLAGMLTDGASLYLFPEGTSSDGRQVLPFKSALLDAAGAGDCLVQPVTLAYHDADAHYAWYGDMTLVPHLGQVLTRPGVTLDIVFHEPVASSDFASRKALTRHVEAQVAAGLDRHRPDIGPPAAVLAPEPTAIPAEAD
jgi:1-acyl-sn-glycerol-3-phosphate acyltransferase